MPAITKRELGKIIQRLEFLYSALDGEKKDPTKLGGDEFTNLQNRISEDLVVIRGKLREKEKIEKKNGNFMELAKLKASLKTKLSDLDSKYSQLERVNKGIQESKKVTAKVKEARAQIVAKLGVVIKHVKGAFDPSLVEDTQEARTDVIKLGDLKKDLIQRSGKKNKDDYINFDDSEDERDDEQIRQWREKDKKLDDKLDDVNILLDEIQHMNKELGKEIDLRDQMVDDANRDAAKVNQALEQHNKQLAQVLKNYRAPSKLCMDCCLCLLLVGLVSVIIMLITNGKG